MKIAIATMRLLTFIFTAFASEKIWGGGDDHAPNIPRTATEVVQHGEVIEATTLYVTPCMTKLDAQYALLLVHYNAEQAELKGSYAWNDACTKVRIDFIRSAKDFDPNTKFTILFSESKYDDVIAHEAPNGAQCTSAERPFLGYLTEHCMLQVSE